MNNENILQINIHYAEEVLAGIMQYIYQDEIFYVYNVSRYFMNEDSYIRSYNCVLVNTWNAARCVIASY